jgi:hypothetical protein
MFALPQSPTTALLEWPAVKPGDVPLCKQNKAKKLLQSWAR